MPPHTILGTTSRGSEVSLSLEDRLRHIAIIGATGAGKSTLLRFLATQDIARGDGLLVLDPMGDLSDAAATQASAARLAELCGSEDLTIEPHYDQKNETHMLRISRVQHGNLKIGYLDGDFLNSGDYLQIVQTAQVLQGLLSDGAFVRRGEQEHRISVFKDALDWLLEEVKKGVAIQRYKGLGEMNPSQLWETTMDPGSRRLLRTQIEDAIAADEIFTTLMGDMVEPRRAFIELNALGVRNLDV